MSAMRWVRLYSLGIGYLGQSERARYFLDVEDLDLVADTNVIVVFHADTTLGAAAYFVDVVLEAAQRFQLTFEDHHVVAQYPNGLVAIDGALEHDTAGHRTELRRTEHIAHFGNADDLFATLRCQHARQRLLHVIQQLVNDAVVADVDAFLLRLPARRGVGANVEADHGSARGNGQVDIRLRNATDPGRHDVDRHFLGRHVVEAGQDRFQRATHVGLDDQRQDLGFVLAHVGKHVFQLGSLLTRETFLTGLVGTSLGDFAGLALVGEHDELVTGVGRAVETQDFHRNGRTGLFGRTPCLVAHCADLAGGFTSQQEVAMAQGACLHQCRRHHTAPFLKARFDDHTGSGSLARSGQLEHLGLQQYRIEQFVDTFAGVGRYFHELNVTAPVLGNHVLGGELVGDPLGIGGVLVDFGDCHDQRHTGSTGVLDGFLGLRHDAVVGGHHQDDHVGRLGAAGTHGRKGGVTRSIQEGDGALGRIHVVGADMLGNATRFAGCHTGFADVVEQRRLAVVDVSHYGHDRRSRQLLSGGHTRLELFGQLRFQLFLGGQYRTMTQFFNHQGSDVLLNGLVDIGHGAQLHQ